MYMYMYTHVDMDDHVKSHSINSINVYCSCKYAHVHVHYTWIYTSCMWLSHDQAYHFHHFNVIEVINDVLQNIPIWDKPQCSEHNHDGYLLPDVGEGGNNTLTNGALLGSGSTSWHQTHPQSTNRTARVLNVWPNFRSVGILWIFLSKDMNCICSHLFLSYQHLLRPIYYEIPPGVKGALIQLIKVSVSQPVQEAIGGAQHYRDLSNECFVVKLLPGILIFRLHCLLYVNIQRGRIPGGSVGRSGIWQ